MLNRVIQITDYNQDEFIIFEEPEHIEFFKNINYILDWNEYKKMSLTELKSKASETLNLYKIKTNEYNSMSKELQSSNQHLDKECKNLDYMMNAIEEIYLIKTKQKEVNFPQVPSSNGFKFIPNNLPYEMSAGIALDTVFLYRKDGRPMNKTERIPSNFYVLGLEIAKSYLGDFYIESNKNTLSEDRKILTIKLNLKIKQEIEQIEEPEKDIMKLSKSLFKRNNKK